MRDKFGLLLVSLALGLGCDEGSPLKNRGFTADAAANGPGGGGQSGAITDQSQAGRTGASTTAGQTGNHSSSASAGGVQAGGTNTTAAMGGIMSSGGLAGGTASTKTGGPGGSDAGGRTGGSNSASTKVTGGAYGVAGTSASRGGSASGGKSTAKGGTSTGGAVGGTSRGGTTTIAGASAGAMGGSTASSMGGQPANDSLGQNPFSRPATSGILFTSSDGTNGIVLQLAADSKGGMFVAGATRNPQAMGLTAFDSGIESEAFAARLDSQGKLLWSVPLKTCGVPADIAAGPDDALFVLCPYVPDYTSVSPATCAPTAVVDKLSGTDGKLLFEAQTKPPAQPVDGYMCPYGLGVDGEGRSYVGGAYMPKSPIGRSILIAVTASGQQDWTLVSEGPEFEPTTDVPDSYISGVDVDSNGNVVFAGSFNLWTKWGTTQLTSQPKSSSNGFFGRVAADGIGITSWSFGGTIFDFAMSITATSQGGFIVGGLGSASSSIGGRSFTAVETGSGFLAQITSAGEATWVKALPNESITNDVAVGSDGKVHFAGLFPNDEILYTYDPATDTLTPRRAVTGNATASRLQTGHVAVSTTGAIWLSGSFKGTIDLGTGPLSTSSAATFLFKID